LPTFTAASCGSVNRHARPRCDVRNLVERLTWLNDFARPCVGDEHGAGAGVGNRRALDAVVQLRDLRIHGGDLRLRGALLLLHGPDLRGLRGNLTSLRGNLLVLRLDLILQHAVVSLRLIELLRGGRLLRVEALRRS